MRPGNEKEKCKLRQSLANGLTLPACSRRAHPILAHAIFLLPVRSRRQQLNRLTSNKSFAFSRPKVLLMHLGLPRKIVLGAHGLAQEPLIAVALRPSKTSYKSLIAKVLLPLSYAFSRIFGKALFHRLRTPTRGWVRYRAVVGCREQVQSLMHTEREPRSRSRPFGDFATIVKCDPRSRKIPDLTLKAVYGNSSRSELRSGQ